ncbi:MAG: caspase family protein [Pseudomonadota bacterium]
MIRVALATLFLAAPALAEDRALVIGIDTYAAPLNGAANDANRMAEAIADIWDIPASQITTLTNAAATSDAIMTALIDELVGKTAPGDKAILYFAGRGTTLADGQTAIIAQDEAALLGKIPSDVIGDILDLVPNRAVTVIIDAGFDGQSDLIGVTQPRGEAGALATETSFASGAVPRTIWTAASTGQFAWDDVDRGVFTHALTTALTMQDGDANSDDVITNAELLVHITTQTTLWCETNATCATTGRGFTPTFAGDPDAVILAKAATAPAPVTDPILPADTAPATYAETLGFITDLFTPNNAAGLTLAMSTGPNPQVGELIEFAISADAPGDLILLDVDPTGHLAQVFPSALAPGATSTLTPDAPLIIPNGTGTTGRPIQIRVSEPSGQGLLLGLLLDGGSAAALLPQDLSHGPLPNAGQHLFEIAQGLLAAQAADDLSWSAAYLPYRITP